MIGLCIVYVLAGLVFAAVAVLSASDPGNPKRWANAGFWGLFAVSFLFGDNLGDFGNGILVLAMVVLAGTVGLGIGQPADNRTRDRRVWRENWATDLCPALAIPVVTVIGSLTLKKIAIDGRALFDPAQTTLISLAIGMLIALSWRACCYINLYRQRSRRAQADGPFGWRHCCRRCWQR